MGDYFACIADNLVTVEGNKLASPKDFKDHCSVLAIADHSLDSHYPFKFKKLKVTEVEKVLKKLNTNKATGWDFLPPKALKSGANGLAVPLTTLYNSCISHSHWPNEWKKGEWTPVYKKDDPMDKQNYRPITIQILLNKVFEQLLSAQITNSFNSRLSECLTAYRKRHSCETALIMLTEKWRQAIDNGESVGLLSTDMSKAFDCLYHPLLLAKLEAYGFAKESLDLMQSYFNDRYNRVRIGNITSSWKKVDRGCPQGSSFGPLLWNIFQNDMTYIIKSNKCMYADDHQFYETHKDIKVIESNLQQCATRATSWYDANFLKGNYKKYGRMMIGKNKEDKDMDINVDKTKVKPEKNITLFGINIDNKLSFTDHISNVCKKSSKKVGVIMRLRNLIPTRAKLQLYKAAILPHLTYCNIVWHFCKASEARKLERVQERALRAVYCDWNSPYKQLLSWANLPTLMNRRLQDIAITMYKVKNKLCPGYITDLFSLNNTTYNLRVKEFQLPRFNTITYGKHSLRYLGPLLWSKLDSDLRNSETIEDFKRRIRKADLEQLVTP